MKYYVMLEITFKDNTKDSLAVYSYDTRDDASASFHKNLGGWIRKDNVQHVMCLLVDYYGSVIRSEYWEAEPEPEPEPEPEVIPEVVPEPEVESDHEPEVEAGVE